MSTVSEDWQRPLTPSKTEEPDQQMKSLFDSTGGMEMYNSTIHVHEVNHDKVSDYYYKPTNGLNRGKGVLGVKHTLREQTAQRKHSK